MSVDMIQLAAMMGEQPHLVGALWRRLADLQFAIRAYDEARKIVKAIEARPAYQELFGMVGWRDQDLARNTALQAQHVSAKSARAERKNELELAEASLLNALRDMGPIS